MTCFLYPVSLTLQICTHLIRQTPRPQKPLTYCTVSILLVARCLVFMTSYSLWICVCVCVYVWALKHKEETKSVEGVVFDGWLHTVGYSLQFLRVCCFTPDSLWISLNFHKDAFITIVVWHCMSWKTPRKKKNKNAQLEHQDLSVLNCTFLITSSGSQRTHMLLALYLSPFE